MMEETNKEYVRNVREELLQTIKKANKQIEETDLIYDIDRDVLRGIRNSLIETVDIINHYEYKELI